MQNRPNFYFEWQTLLNKVYDIKQGLHADKSLSSDVLLERELAVERMVISGIQAISDALDSETERQKKGGVGSDNINSTL